MRTRSQGAEMAKVISSQSKNCMIAADWPDEHVRVRQTIKIIQNDDGSHRMLIETFRNDWISRLVRLLLRKEPDVIVRNEPIDAGLARTLTTREI